MRPQLSAIGTGLLSSGNMQSSEILGTRVACSELGVAVHISRMRLGSFIVVEMHFNLPIPLPAFHAQNRASTRKM